MSQDTPCPDQSQLENFVLGQVDEDLCGQVESHLESCQACISVLRELNASDDLIEAAQAYSSFGSQSEPPAILKGLVDRLKNLDFEPPLHGDPVEDYAPYLDPPQIKGEIGRLGPYGLRKVLGAGAMGVVFLAQEIPLEREVALKLMRASLLRDVGARQRLLREARATAGVVNDHIVPIYSVGEEQGVPYLAMPVLQGESLSDCLAREGKLPTTTVLEVGRQIALGLAAAHGGGLVHRDVKPANVWLEPASPTGSLPDLPTAGKAGCRVRLLDFGLVLEKSCGPHLTEVGLLLGTPAYMAPEQARGKPVDARADLFSLGSVLYAMLTGHPPFQGANNLAVLHALAYHTPAPLRQEVPEVPRSVAALMDKLHAQDRADRFQSAEEVVAALEACRAEIDLPPTKSWRAWIGGKHRFTATALLLVVAGLLLAGSLKVASWFPAGAPGKGAERQFTSYSSLTDRLGRATASH